LVVPLTGLLLGVTSLTASGESLALLLAQPVSRCDVLAGKYAGLCLALAIAQALGFGGGGLVIALQAGTEQLAGFGALPVISIALGLVHRAAGRALTVISIALGMLSVAAALAIAAVFPDRLRALSAALLLWLLMVVAYDLAVLGATAMLSGPPLETVLFPAL